MSTVFHEAVAVVNDVVGDETTLFGATTYCIVVTGCHCGSSPRR
jgi:hypothetical protein